MVGQRRKPCLSDRLSDAQECLVGKIGAARLSDHHSAGLKAPGRQAIEIHRIKVHQVNAVRVRQVNDDYPVKAGIFSEKGGSVSVDHIQPRVNH